MTDSTNRLVTTIVAGGAIACVLTALLLRPIPFSESAAARWVTIERSWTHPIAGRSYSLDTVVVGRRQRPYDGRPQAMGLADSFDVHGWAFDPNFQRSADHFVYRVDDAPWRDATYHVPRPDVAAALHLPKVADSGFDVVIPPRTLSPGHHTLELATMDGPSPPVPLPQTLTLDVSAR